MIIFIVSSEMCFKNIWANCFHNLSVVSFNLVEGIISNQIYFHVHLMVGTTKIIRLFPTTLCTRWKLVELHQPGAFFNRLSFFGRGAS